ncbi:integrase catalytic domain-containing protein [Trichonephila clavipes]|nr:integrase catalytic domain-containing protein [Trichonephila clavipes]
MYKNALKEDLIRVVEDLDGTVESTDTIAKLKTKIENSSTFEGNPDFVKTLIQNCIDERVSRNEREVTLEKQKIELAKLQLTQLEKEVELQTAKNKALSLNPAAKVEEKQFETNIENMINSIRTLSLPVPTRSENFNLFFQSLERAFLTKKINDEYKSEILINLLGERAHNVLLYIKEEELNDYEKLKSIETATHIGIREAEDWFRPIDLAKECDIYISSRSGSHKEIPITYGYTQDPFKNRSQNFKSKIKENYPQYLERENKNCYICGDSSHYARDCAHAYAYPNVVSVSNVIENSSYDLPHILLWYPWKGKKEYVPLRTAYSQDSRYGMQPKARQSSRAGAAKTRTETFELVEEKQKTLGH